MSLYIVVKFKKPNILCCVSVAGIDATEGGCGDVGEGGGKHFLHFRRGAGRIIFADQVAGVDKALQIVVPGAGDAPGDAFDIGDGVKLTHHRGPELVGNTGVHDPVDTLLHALRK